MTYRMVFGLFAIGVLQGCATGTEKVDADFGNSVRQMIAAQKIESPAVSPSSYDGRQAEKVIQTYRASIGKPEQLATDVRMNTGK